MSKIAKCPICGGVPLDKWEVTSVRVFQTGQACCGVDCNTNELWNQYTAAMELAKAAVWAAECEDQKDYMDDVTSNLDAWRSIVNLDLEANDKACEAHARVLEVFGK